MRKHDFWPVELFLNGQKLGVKKGFLHVYFEGLTTDSYYGKIKCMFGNKSKVSD